MDYLIPTAMDVPRVDIVHMETPPATSVSGFKGVAALTLPVFNPIIVNLMKEKGIDARHQLDMDVRAYPSIAAFYAALATGEADTTVVGGPTVFQKMRNEGVPIRIAATIVPQSDLVILTASPAIQSLVDLKGKTLAADMGSQQYQAVAI